MSPNRHIQCPCVPHKIGFLSFSQHTTIELSSPSGLGSDMPSVVFNYIGMKKVGDNPHLLTTGDGRLFRPQFSFHISYVL